MNALSIARSEIRTADGVSGVCCGGGFSAHSRRPDECRHCKRANAEHIAPRDALPHLTPVRIGSGKSVHLGHKAAPTYGQVYVSNGCPAGTRSLRAASAAGKLQAITIVDEDIDCAACLKDVTGLSGLPRASAAATLNAQRAAATPAAAQEAPAATPAAGILDGTGPRGPVSVSQPTTPAHGASTRWARTIRGARYTFSAVIMPNGERRLNVSRYNGYGNDGTEAGIRSGMRFGCAWSPVRSITIPAPAAATLAATPAQEATVNATPINDAAEVAHEIASMEADGVLRRTPAAAARTSFTQDFTGQALDRNALGTPAHTIARDALQAFNAQEWDTARRIIAAAMGAGLLAPADGPSWAAMLATVDAAQERAEGGDAAAAEHAAVVAQYGDNDAERAAAPHRAPAADYVALGEVDADALATAFSVMSDIDADEAVKILDVLGDKPVGGHAADAMADAATERAQVTAAAARVVATIDAAADETAGLVMVQAMRDDAAARVAQEAPAARTPAQERAAARRAQESTDIDAEVQRRYREAEGFTNGHMLNPAGKARGINARTLFTGQASRVDMYASEELQEYFTQYGRMTIGDYRRAMSGERAPVRVTIGHDAADAPAAAAQVGTIVADATDADGGALGDDARAFTLPRAMRGSALKPVRRALADAYRGTGVTFSVTGGAHATVTATAGAAQVDWARVGGIIRDTLAAPVAADA